MGCVAIERAEMPMNNELMFRLTPRDSDYEGNGIVMRHLRM